MSITLDYKNVEQIVFHNKTIIEQLQKYKNIFDTWLMASTVPQLRYIKNNIVITFLNYLDKNDLEIISNILGVKVLLSDTVQKPIENISSVVDSLEFDLPEDFNCIDFCLYRKKENIEVTLWK